jgi:hypothetical protein
VRIHLALIVALCTPACAGPPAPQPIEGEPICADFEVGRTKMQGSLRFPVTLVIKEEDTLLSRTTLMGLRDAKTTKSHALLRDEDSEVTLEWAQCENQRAPRAVNAGRDPKDATAFECGQTKVYKTEKLTIRKGDPASRVVRFAEPPNVTCWNAERASAPTAPENVGRPEEDAGAGTPDASASDADAGTDPADAGAPSAADAATTPPDAGAPKKKKPNLPG